MASLFPEIEVFTTGYSFESDLIKYLPMKFARKLKVLNLRRFIYGDETFEGFDIVIDKLEGDGVTHIDLLSFPSFYFGGQEYRKSKMRYIEAECNFISRILSRVSVDHLLFLHPMSTDLEEIYAICAQIDCMHVQRGINVYFPSFSMHRYDTKVDPCRPFRLTLFEKFDRNERSESINLNLRLDRGRREGEETYSDRVLPKGSERSPFELHPPVEDQADMCKMLKVHISRDGRYKPPDEYSDYLVKLPPTQGLSLEDFPHIDIRLDCNDKVSTITETKLSMELGITTESYWPRRCHSWELRELAKDTKSACFDTRELDRGIRADEGKPCDMLNLPESLNMISPEFVQQHPFVTVAILDTGISACSTEFLNKIVALKNFVPNEANDLCYDGHGHGTRCARIVLQTSPFVRLAVCKVIGAQGVGELKWAADAIDWLINDEHGPKNYCPVDIISMSFGCVTFDPDMRRAVSEAVSRGKVVVAAASNDGRKKMTNIAFPARFGDVICVGSCNNLGQPSSFTPTGREIDFLAPGEGVLFGNPRMSGTSEAAPIVAGIAAMVISYADTTGGHAMRSAVSDTTVMREILRKMASMPGHHDEHMGYGNLDPWRLFKYGPVHFRQVVEEVVGPLPVVQHVAAATTHSPTNMLKRKRRASDSEVKTSKRT